MAALSNGESPWGGLQDITVSRVVNVFVKFKCEIFGVSASPVAWSSLCYQAD